MNPDWSQTLLLGGPTASGKSAVALALAEQLGGEIVSVDSVQVYRGLDIGASKPTPQERRRVPHHLLDVAPVHEPFDAARFVAMARAVTAQIQRRGRLAILCGGTGMWFKALLLGLDPLPGADPALRAELAQKPLADLAAELRGVDPHALTGPDWHNRRRLERAVEILRLTGCSPRQRRQAWQSAPPPVRLWCLQRSPADLRKRIEHRVDRMFAEGLVEETRQALAAGLATNPTACRAIGYRQVIEYLRGERDLPVTVALVKQRTWQFARRQMTWFRHQLPVSWLEVPAEEPPEQTARRLRQAAAAGCP